MTREEAIQALKDLAEINVRYGCDDKWITALNMAIEALQVEPNCQKCAIKELWKETEKEDLVSVVRCKECRHQRFYINDKESFHCDKSGVVNMHIDDGDGEFFCKYGERKE